MAILWGANVCGEKLIPCSKISVFERIFLSKIRALFFVEKGKERGWTELVSRALIYGVAQRAFFGRLIKKACGGAVA